jgi:hypothetical protein
MTLYLDDDSVDRHLVALLRKAGHTVVLPADVGMAGTADPLHLLHALQQRWTLLTRNNEDFTNLHKLVLGCGGHRSGILIACYDNDPTRDMKPGTVVRAIRKIEAAGISLSNERFVLNHWR